jgi:hypothetical protein
MPLDREGGHEHAEVGAAEMAGQDEHDPNQGGLSNQPAGDHPEKVPRRPPCGGSAKDTYADLG